MEVVQYIDYRVVDGAYRARLHWLVKDGVVMVQGANGWEPTTVRVEFIRDHELYAVESERQMNKPLDAQTVDKIHSNLHDLF